MPIRLPPLRERLEDVPDLARAFLRKAESEGLPRKPISKEALDILKKQDWPGNVRELENLMRRLCVLCPDDVISGAVVTQEMLGAAELGRRARRRRSRSGWRTRSRRTSGATSTCTATACRRPGFTTGS